MVSGHTANVLVGKPAWGFESLRERYAGMVELVDAAGSEPARRNPVSVRVRLPVL